MPIFEAATGYAETVDRVAEVAAPDPGIGERRCGREVFGW